MNKIEIRNSLNFCMCGDFNSIPNSNVYNFIKTLGKCKIKDNDYLNQISFKAIEEIQSNNS